jgi:hypothetical protein
MARDKTQRMTLARVDDRGRQGKVVAARRLIYEKHYRVDAVAIEALLKDQSLVPSMVRYSYFVARWVQLKSFPQNAFSDRLERLGFDLYKIFVPDIMHDFELGGWRMLYTHLLRILQSINQSRLGELDRRYVASIRYVLL